MPKSLVSVAFETYERSVAEALDKAGAAGVLAEQSHVLLKPNLINTSPHPVTTPAACCAAVIAYVRAHSDAAIVIGEGCGAPSVDTGQVFEALGYRALAKRCGAELVDLNTAPLRRLENRTCRVFPELYLPEIALTHYLVSIPVLKAHSLAMITGTLKNMIGLAPPRHYAGHFGTWKKAVFHGDMQQSITDLVAYRRPDLTLMDASVGLADYHLGGPTCDPPVARILAGTDPWAVDREAARLLGLDWRAIPHLVDGRD